MLARRAPVTGRGQGVLGEKLVARLHFDILNKSPAICLRFETQYLTISLTPPFLVQCLAPLFQNWHNGKTRFFFFLMFEFLVTDPVTEATDDRICNSKA